MSLEWAPSQSSFFGLRSAGSDLLQSLVIDNLLDDLVELHLGLIRPTFSRGLDCAQPGFHFAQFAQDPIELLIHRQFCGVGVFVGHSFASVTITCSSVRSGASALLQSFRPSFLRRLLYTRLLRPGLWRLRCFASVEQRLDLLIRTRLRRDQRLDLRRVLDLRRLYPAKLLVVGFHTLSHSIKPSIRRRGSAIERGYVAPQRVNALRKLYLRVYEGVEPAFRVNVRLILAGEPILVKLEHLDKSSVRRRHLAEGLLEPLLPRLVSHLGVDESVEAFIGFMAR